MNIQLDRLKSQLLTSGVQQENNALFQVINQLIDFLRGEVNATQTSISGGGGGGGGAGLLGATYLTKNKEIGLPNSLQEIAGAGIQFNDVSGKRIITAAIPFGMDSGGEGEDGPPGPPGKDGTIGINGTPGRDGIQFIPLDGEDGIDGDPGVIGPQGFPGSIGNTGPPGIPGIDGLEGEQGEEGIQGIQGIRGIDGLIGSIGPIGPSGLDAEEPEYPYLIPGPQGIPGVGGASATTVEVNLGVTANWRGRFTITDAAITAIKKVLISQAPGPYTGKGTLPDEAEMDPIWCVASPSAGIATVYWRTMAGITMQPQEVRGLQPVTGVNTQHGYPNLSVPRFTPTILGRVKGNVKFTYMVM